jgi:hypothetical protein
MKRKTMSLNEALEAVAGFITSLSTGVPRAKDRITPEILFLTADDGELLLDGETAEKYQECLTNLIDGIGTEQISPRAIEKLYQKAIMASLDVNKRRQDQSFANRLDAAIKGLEIGLKAKPHSFTIYYPIGGLAPEELPFLFGNVNFCLLEKEEVNKLRGIPEGLQPSPTGQMINEGILGKPIGIVTVMATENGAAKTLALKELRLTLDALNFYSDLPPLSHGFAFLPGDREQSIVTMLIMSDGNKRVGQEVVGPLIPMPLKRLDEIEKEHGIGILAVSCMLKEKKGGLQEKLLSAIQWAGRATADSRKEEAFLLYAIALESLILAENEKDELLFRLRTRIAHLLGKDIESKKKIYERVRDLYRIRSQIVHSGKYQVTDSDLGQMRFLTKNCILRVLTEQPFVSFGSIDDLVNWFNDRILE